MSPNWPDKYPSRKECTWNISSTAGHRVKIVSHFIKSMNFGIRQIWVQVLAPWPAWSMSGSWFPAGKWGDAVNLAVGALSRRREHPQSSVTTLLTAELCEVVATTQVCSAVCDSVVSRADLLQNILLLKKKTKTEDLIYTER